MVVPHNFCEKLLLFFKLFVVQNVNFEMCFLYLNKKYYNFNKTLIVKKIYVSFCSFYT